MSFFIIASKIYEPLILNVVNVAKSVDLDKTTLA